MKERTLMIFWMNMIMKNTNCLNIGFLAAGKMHWNKLENKWMPIFLFMIPFRTDLNTQETISEDEIAHRYQS